jgi:hypothetical protein
MLAHLRFHTGVFVLPLADDALSERSRRAWAGERSGASPWSLRSSRSSLASSGVCSVVRLEVWLCREREERVDFWDVGRELGVRVEPHGPSGVSMVTVLVQRGERCEEERSERERRAL